VRTEQPDGINDEYVKCGQQRTRTARAVSHQLLTTKDRVRIQDSASEVCGGEVTLGMFLIGVLRTCLVSIIPALLFIHSCIIWGMDNVPATFHSSRDKV
jgi:hypothetical protein